MQTPWQCRKLIYDDKKITMAELIDALKKDFEGYDELRYMLIHDAAEVRKR